MKNATSGLSQLLTLLVAVFSLFFTAGPVLAQTANVNIIHNSAHPAAASVDVYVNGTRAREGFAFRTATGYIELPAGTELTIDITAPGAPDNSNPVFSTAVTLADGGNYVVVASGDPTETAGPTAFSLFVAPGRQAAETAGNTELLVFHGATDAPSVDIALRGGDVLVPNIAFGDFSGGYLSVPPAAYNLEVRPAGTTTAAATFTADLGGAADAAIVVLASGYLVPTGNQPAFGLLAVFADGTTALLPGFSASARLQVIHNAPQTAAALVDVYVNGARLLQNFAFRAATPFIDVPAEEELLVALAPAGSASVDDAIATFPVTLAEGGTYVAIAGGSELGLGLFAAAGRETAASDEAVDILVFHGSPDAPAVDVAARGVGVLVPDIAFGDFSAGYLSVPPATYTLDILPAGGETVVASFDAGLAQAAGAALTVVASGFLAPGEGEAAFGLLAVFADGTTALLPATADEDPASARVQVIHNSAHPAAASVDVWINGDRAIENFAFRAATPFIDLPAETELTIAITGPGAANADNPVFSTNVTLADGGTYVVVASGDPTANDDTAFSLFVSAGREAATSNEAVDVLVFHGATDAPAVDVAARGVGVLVPSIAFGDFSADYLSVPPAAYTLDILPAGGEAIVASFQAGLAEAAGAALTVVASGYLAPGEGEAAFGLLAVFADGTTALLPATVAEPGTARVQVIHNSAHPAAASVDVWINGDRAIEGFAFRSATPFIDLPAETELTIAITGPGAANADSPVFSTSVTLADGGTYVVIAAGDPTASGDTAFNLFVAEGRETSAAATEVDVLIFHGVTDAPAVDVAAAAQPPVVLTSGLAFGAFEPYIGLPEADYQLDILASGAGALVASFGAPLATLDLAGTAIVVVASGFLSPGEGEAGFGLFAALPAGGELVALPVVSGINVDETTFATSFTLHGNYPNPFNPQTTVSFSLAQNAEVYIVVYDMLGRQVMTSAPQSFTAGENRNKVIDGSSLSSGTYIYRVVANGVGDVVTASGRMVLLK
jgi:hypothetical protein